MTRKTLKLALASLLLTPVLSLASVPGTIAFSARIADNGRPLTGAHNFTFKLFDDPGAGNELWKWSATDAPAALTVADGVVAYALGSDNALTPATLFTGTVSLYLEVTMDGATMSPRIALQTVPFAFRAAVADSVPYTGVTGAPATARAKSALTGFVTLPTVSTYTTVASIGVTFPAAGYAYVDFTAEPYLCGSGNTMRVMMDGVQQRFGYFETASTTTGYPHPLSRSFVIAVAAGAHTFNGDLAPGTVACSSYNNEISVLFVPNTL